MSRKAIQDVPKLTAASTLNPSAGTGPTFKDFFGTLRLCLRYSNDNDNIFKRLIEIMESNDLIDITSKLPEEELERLVPMIAQRLTRIRLDIGDIIKLNTLCQKGGVSALPFVRRCDLVGAKTNRTDDLKSSQLMLIGQLLPCLDHLNLQAKIMRPFPNNFRMLSKLIVHQCVTQELLDRICDNCPRLQQLYTRNVTDPDRPLDVAHIVKCKQLWDLQLPLMLQTPVAICHLKNLKQLTLQRQKLWPETDWLCSVREIIVAKRDALQRFCFDGTWLAAPLDLSVFQLHRCWALRDLLLSNCNLAEPTNGLPVLPMSCQRFGLMKCNLSILGLFLKGSALMELLELYKCQITTRGKLLMQILGQRQHMPTLYPLRLRFSSSTPLRSELISWDEDVRRKTSEWLLIQELHENEMTWRQQLSTITMTFGPAVNNFPADLSDLKI